MSKLQNNTDLAIKDFDDFTSRVGYRSYTGEYSLDLVAELEQGKDLKTTIENFYREVSEDFSRDDFGELVKIEMEALVNLLDKWVKILA
jgi:hypothetical protein